MDNPLCAPTGWIRSHLVTTNPPSRQKPVATQHPDRRAGMMVDMTPEEEYEFYARADDRSVSSWVRRAVEHELNGSA